MNIWQYFNDVPSEGDIVPSRACSRSGDVPVYLQKAENIHQDRFTPESQVTDANKKPEIKVQDKIWNKHEEKYQNQEMRDKGKSCIRDGVDLKLPKGKQKCLNQYSANVAEISLSKEPENDDTPSIVLLLPKDSSRPCSPDLYRKASNGKFTQHIWGNFSQLFSADEIRAAKSFSETRNFCSLNETKSLSAESSNQRVLSSMNALVKSGSALSETAKSNISNIIARAKSTPLRRFIYPLLKSKLLKMKPQIPAVVPGFENPVAQTVKALLYLTVKSGVPLFKFVVENNNEILASTVKSLIYTFYSVRTVTKNTSGWKNRKIKPGGCEYNVIGQMKVSNSNFPREERSEVKESVLYSVDVSKSDGATSECMTSTELAAIVVNVVNETVKCNSPYSRFQPDTVVILPGGDHSLPHEGVASSLINRWRTGGLCDCGGWDEGCKLRILADVEEKRDPLIHSRRQLRDFRCGLYDQGDSKQNKAFFRMVPCRDGVFSVEFDAKMSSLQAFSICVAIINSKQSG